MPERSETSYIVHDIIPIFTKFGYPKAGDHERVKINDVPIYRPSGGRSGSTMDIVYYHSGEPLLLIEAKRKHKSHESALKEAQNYIKNFPRDNKTYAPSGRAPEYIATTVGREIKFYKNIFKIVKNQIEQTAKPIDIITFEELLEKYGLIEGYKAKVLDAESFRNDFLYPLADAYNISKDKIISPIIIKNIALHILNYLRYQKTYIDHPPFNKFNSKPLKQEYIKDIHKRFDLIKSLGPEIATEFRSFILRAFQGTELNQYLTEQCVIEFMFDIIGKINKNWKVLDFECGSGGFLAVAAANRMQLKNMLGIEIDELPFIIAQTYLSLYFCKKGKEIDKIPIKLGNGLLDWGNNWDLIVGNPAGSVKYKRKDINEVLENLERDLNRDGRDDIFSEYNFSIQQAVKSCKIGGKICLLLPEGFFSNSQYEFLRKHVSKHCKILAIVSLPRGIFKRGKTVKARAKGSQITPVKMSIIYAKKVKSVNNREGTEIDINKLKYPVFMANVSAQKPTREDISNWLKPRLEMVLKEWKSWKHKQQLVKLQ
ncbi:MAG: SAM-dependent methyltransferase [Actinobacteria bacterium]|nr:SAM-dependent methyltransferase [Actinomycetota bacterium]